jgi:hypothetical protein
MKIATSRAKWSRTRTPATARSAAPTRCIRHSSSPALPNSRASPRYVRGLSFLVFSAAPKPICFASTHHDTKSSPLALCAYRSRSRVGTNHWCAISCGRPAQLDSSVYAGFLLGMHEQGVEGRDYSFEWRFAEGSYERLAEMARELVGLKVDVIFATSTPATLAAKEATTSIPIVMGYFEDDPIERGLARSLGHPARNITGLAVMQNELLSKHFRPYKNTLSQVEPPRHSYKSTNLPYRSGTCARFGGNARCDHLELGG